jgi:glycosyltransferase involved in cell wall biosynthesis
VKRTRRILFCIGSLREGGAEGQLVHLAKGLKKKGWQVAVMTLRPEGVRRTEVQDLGMELIDLDIPTFRPQWWNPITWLKTLGCWWKTRQVIRRFNPDVIHAWLFWAHFWTALCLIGNRRRLFITSRRQTWSDKGKSRLFRLMENWVNRRTHGVIANSDRVAQAARNHEKHLKKKLHVIRNGIDINLYRHSKSIDWEQEFQRPEQTGPVAINVANYLYHKGQEDLLHAWKLVVEKFPEALLLCVGKDDGRQGELEGLSQQLGIQDHVLFTGARQDIPNLLQSAKIAIQASLDEGMPNAVLEYVAAGLPVVATDVGGTSEILGKKGGLLVAPNNSDQLASAILQALSNPEEAKEQAHNAFQRLKKHHSLREMVEQHEGCYERMKAKR